MNQILIPAILLAVLTGCRADAISDQGKKEYSIDLSTWKLTLPVDENKDGKPDEYVDLTAYRSNGAIAPYMYDGEDGSLVFYCQYTGIATTNSRYSRTELREQLVAGDNATNWSMKDGGVMKGSLKVGAISSGHRTIVMQIHGRLTDKQKEVINTSDNDAPPLLKIYFQNNKVRVVRKILVDEHGQGEAILPKKAWKDDAGHYFKEQVDNRTFTLEVIASQGRLEVKLNGVSKVYDDISMQKWPFENYFKAGNYLQSSDSGAFAKVEFYTLNVTH
ncbi:polysaccharide lyase family 7 protein [Fulvivirgaceae bacterium BMA12]|uniref:Polysaccharide lyase family 7 protein n=1 Tax=Agaribacillus aureus TaxID=3051825 RepID=A0ABT8LAW6_9BACT|nr:polysaccharide lyase family 7 protein [Fulvivirgaceae bacterium BMA12]